MLFPKTLSISGNMPFAQNELARCLSAMSGAEIHTDGYPFAILADQTEGEGYRVEVTEQRTVIQADSPRAAVYGVYGLLNGSARSFWLRTAKFCPKSPIGNRCAFPPGPILPIGICIGAGRWMGASPCNAG